MYRLILMFGVLVLSISVKTSADEFYGPFDYTNPVHVTEKLPIVEKYHFTPGIESLTESVDGSFVGGHLWYTVRAFPNHHRALNSMARLWRIHMRKNGIPPGVEPHLTPEYLFERAIKFAPHDGTVRLLYGMHLQKIGKQNEALKLYEQAAATSPNSAEVHYNLGLLYLKLRKSDQAKFHASKAYGLGYPLPGLRNKMIAAGLWSKGTAP